MKISIKLIVSLIVIIFAIALSLPLFAESIFLKDGSIIEGDIIKETDKAMDVKLPDGKKMTIQRKDVLRTLLSNAYKTKMYIMKNDKTVLPVYIVEEDNDKYVCRKDLYSTDEFVVNKDEVMFISKVAPETIISDKGKEKKVTSYTREQNITWRAPRLRFGYSNIALYADSDIHDGYEDSRNINFVLDWFPLIWRNEQGSGFDVITRLRFSGNYDEVELSDKRTPLISNLYNATILGKYDSHLNILFLSGGVRYSYSKYFYGVGIQPYVFGLFQFVVWDDIRIEVSENGGWIFPDGTTEKNISPERYGFQIGCGVDIGLTSYFGIFIEGMYGYVPVKFKDGKTRNVDGYYIYYGVTWRTSYGLIE